MTMSVRKYFVEFLTEMIEKGQRALIVEFFDSVNIKRGLQFYLRSSWPSADPIAANTPRYVYFKTGDKPVIVKSRIVSYIGEEFALTISANPTITAATGTTINPSNLNTVNPQVTTVTAIKDPTVTDEGVPIEDEPEYYYGGTSQGNRDANSIPPESERIIPANSEFLVKIEGAGRFSYRLEWYEGDPESFNP